MFFDFSPTQPLALEKLRSDVGTGLLTAEELQGRFRELVRKPSPYAPCFESRDSGSATELSNFFGKSKTPYRLLRHYSARGILSPPEKEKGENRYGFRHLLELMAMTRLQMRGGLTLEGIGAVLGGSSDEDLHRIVTEEAELSVTVSPAAADSPDASPRSEERESPRALAAELHEMRRKMAASEKARATPRSSFRPDGGPSLRGADLRTHHQIDFGLELVVSEDFRMYGPSHENHLMRQIQHALEWHREPDEHRPTD